MQAMRRLRQVAAKCFHGGRRSAQSSQAKATVSGRNMLKMDGELLMAARETFAQCEKRELDLRLNQELEGTFPASDPLKITRRTAQFRSVADRTPKDATIRKNDI
jgi:hypothetical protein